MPINIVSPPLEDLGAIPPGIDSILQGAASETLRHPDFVEEGRLSQSIEINDDSPDTALYELALRVGEDFLNSKLAPGSVAVVSVVTDAESYRQHTRDTKAASYWHQDFVDTERGFFFPPPERIRLIIPGMIGPISAVGGLSIDRPVRIEATLPNEQPDREAALAAGPVVLRGRWSAYEIRGCSLRRRNS